MKTPIKNCAITFDSGNIKVESATAYIEVHLNFLTQGNNENKKKLVIKNTPTSPTDPVVIVTKVIQDNVASQDDDGINKALGNLLKNWFNDNLSEFNHIFATVDLNITAAAGEGFQYLLPTTTSYAYVEGSTEDNCILAILSMVNNHPADLTVQSVQAGAIPFNSRACLSMFKELFISEMILSNMIHVFTSASAGDFITTRNGSQVENKNTVDLDTVKYGAVTYKPKMEKFTLHIDADVITVYMFVHVNISSGIDTYTEVTGYYHVKLVTDQNGNQKMTYEVAQEPQKNSWTEVAPWVTGVEAAA